MLISNLGDSLDSDHRGKTFAFKIDEHVRTISLGILGSPETQGGRIRVELTLKDSEGKLVRSLPRWPESRTGLPAKMISMEKNHGNFDLPLLHLNHPRADELKIHIRARKRDIQAMRNSQTKLYVSVHSADNSLNSLTIRRVA